jgi:hypothetical protein
VLGLQPILCAQVEEEQAVETPGQRIRNPEDTFRIEKPDYAEYFLALEKPGFVKRLRFYETERLDFKLKKESHWQKSLLVDIRKDYFVSDDFARIYFEDIKSVRIRRDSWFLNQGSILLPIAGLGYFLMDTLNPANRFEGEPVITNRNITLSGSLLMGGLLCQIFKTQRYRMGKWKYLKAIQKF